MPDINGPYQHSHPIPSRRVDPTVDPRLVVAVAAWQNPDATRAAIAQHGADLDAVARTLTSAPDACPDYARLADAKGWLNEHPDTRLVAWTDAEFPPGLADPALNAPPVLWVQGDLPQAGVVGLLGPTFPIKQDLARRVATDLTATGRRVATTVAGPGQAVIDPAIEHGRGPVVINHGSPEWLTPHLRDLLTRGVDAGGCAVHLTPPHAIARPEAQADADAVLVGLSDAVVVTAVSPDSPNTQAAELAARTGRPVTVVESNWDANHQLLANRAHFTPAPALHAPHLGPTLS